MSLPLIRIARASLGACLVALALTACGRAPTLPEPSTPPAETLADGFHPTLQEIGTAGSEETLELRMTAVGVDAGIAAYQGELTYARDGLEFASGALPEGVPGSVREVAPGRVRFVGAAPDGIGERPMAVLRFRATRPVVEADFHVTVEELVGVEGFVDLTSMVVERAHPLFRPASRS